MIAPHAFAGKTIVVRIDESPFEGDSTLAEDLAFLLERDIRPIVVAAHSEAARGYVRALNRNANLAVGLSGADAALLPVSGSASVGRVQTKILATLSAAGYIPVIEPTAFGLGGREIALSADEVAAAIASATEAARALFFHHAGGLSDPDTATTIAELTPSEALAFADRDGLDPLLGTTARAAARAVRAGVGAAQILNGRIAHAAIVELLTARHLGTQVAGAVYVGGSR